MSWEYVERKVEEALKLSGGNVTRARQQLIAWTYEDTKLLHELTKPHMTGISAHAIGRVISKQSAAAADLKNIPIPKQTNGKNGEFGLEIIKAIANGGSPQFGMEGNAAPSGRKQASKSHIDAIKRMAKKSDD